MGCWENPVVRSSLAEITSSSRPAGMWSRLDRLSQLAAVTLPSLVAPTWTKLFGGVEVHIALLAIALFAALVPLVLALDGGFTPEHWRISSLFWAAFASIGIGLGVRSGWASWAANSPGRRFAFLLQLGGFILLLVLQLWNAIAVQKGWPYLLGLVGNLGYAFIHFMGLVNPSADRSEG